MDIAKPGVRLATSPPGFLLHSMLSYNLMAPFWGLFDVPKGYGTLLAHSNPLELLFIDIRLTLWTHTRTMKILGPIVASIALVFAASFECRASGIVFRNSAGNYISWVAGWDHMAFEIDGYVWESHPGYDYPGFFGFAWDADEARYVVMPTEAGVQRWHTIGSFRWDSSYSDPANNEVIAAPILPIDYSLASAMEAEALAVQGYGYPSIPSLFTPWGISPQIQKGASGTFTCVGFVEYLAEAAGHHSGQGFIPNDLETIRVGEFEISALTPGLLYAAIVGNWTPTANSRRLHGIIDPVDFVLTDPVGRRVGYTESTGVLSEIPGVIYTGNGDFEELIMDEPIAGSYQVDLFGLGTNAFFAIGDGGGGGCLYNGFLASGETVSCTFEITSEDASDGDFNGDNFVDAADYVVLRANGGSPVEFELWRANFGNFYSQSASSFSVSIPEPPALVLAANALILFCRRRQ